MRGPPETRKGALAGAPILRRSHRPLTTNTLNTHASAENHSRGFIGWLVVSPDSLVIGNYSTRLEAAQASGVRS
jgi:hypothetical protein